MIGAADTTSELRQVLERSRVGFELTRVRADSVHDWQLTAGSLQHSSRGFFSVNGVRQGSEEFVLLYQPQGAVTGVLSRIVDGERQFLLQARAEPGCFGEAQFGPTVQSTPANFMRLHGGASTPYVDAFIAFDPQVTPIDDTTQLDLGERYYFKSKRSILAETSAHNEPREGFVWATRRSIREGLAQSAFFNIDLRSILAIGNWSSREDTGELTPRSTALCASLEAPLRADVIGGLFSHLTMSRAGHSHFVPLESLNNWSSSEWGWHEREPKQGFTIDFFHVKAALREVQEWTQPLVNSVSEGHVVLACRENRGTMEFLVRLSRERGLATGCVLAPSYVRYPGVSGETPYWIERGQSEVLCSTTESDEGGRFYRDTSRYEILRVADSVETPGDPSAWLRLSELKAFLRMSNVCSIQLRGAVSQLLAAE